MQQQEMFPKVLIDVTVKPHLQGLVLRHIDSKKRFRVGIFSIETIKNKLGSRSSTHYEEWDLHGLKFTVNTARVQSFLGNIKCVGCGIVGNIFLVEKQKDHEVLYLAPYCIDKQGLHQFTSDHILPNSFGGKDVVSNFQTMCSSCNQRKANVMSVEEMGTVLSNLSKYAKVWVDHGRIESLVFMQYQMEHSKEPSKKLFARYESTRRLMTVERQHRHNSLIARTPEQVLKSTGYRFPNEKEKVIQEEKRKAPPKQFNLFTVRNAFASLAFFAGALAPIPSYTDEEIGKPACEVIYAQVADPSGNLADADLVKCNPPIGTPLLKM